MRGVRGVAESGASLTAHLPRLAIEWLAERPGDRHQLVAGSLVFVDISGFTAMSEQLGRLGKEGSEAVASVIGDTFSDLLSVAYDGGGSLLKFGGDALLLLFRGDGHERRAASAAAGMRSRLAAISPIATSAGPVPLGMSAGVASGDVHLFLVGEAHRELIVTGPVASEVVALEHEASAGQIAISDRVASHLPAGTLIAAAEGQGWRLVGSLESEPAVPILDPPAVDVTELIPAGLRPVLAGGGADAEHRYAAVGFIRFRGLDRLLRSEGDEAAAGHLDELVRLAQRQADAAGVVFLASDVDIDGGKLILAAGVPDAASDVDERMARALRGVLDADPPIELQMGMHSGRVFAGEIGPPYRRTYTVMGDVVNTAARLMAHAAIGDLLTSHGSGIRISGQLEVESVTPFVAKGKAEPVAAVRVSGAVSRRSGLRHEAAFVGRERELADLGSLVDAAASGMGGSLVIEGPAGIGKTRLIGELRRLRPEIAATELAGDRFRTSTPYGALRSWVLAALRLPEDTAPDVALRRLGAALAAVGSPVAKRVDGLGVLFGADAGERNEQSWRRQLRADVVFMFDALLAGPRLIVVDDAQWLDPASVDMVEAIVAAAAVRPWAVVQARRPEGDLSRDIAGDVVALGPLDTDRAMALANAASTVPLLPTTARLLAERAGGHPLFVLELSRSVDRLADPDALPETVEAMVASSIDRLHPADRAVLRRAAVLGPSFSVDEARELLALDGTPVEGSSTVAFGALGEFLHIEAGRAQFRQMLYCDVAYAGLPFRLRRSLHATAGRMLEASSTDTDAVAGSLAAHFHAAGDHERTWRWARAAGAVARRSRAHRDTERAFRLALDVAPKVDHDPASECEAWTALGDALRHQGLLDQAGAAYARARKLVGADRRAAARLCFLEGLARQASGRLPAAVRWFNRGLALLDAPGTPLTMDEAVDRVRLLLAVAAVRFNQGRHRQCERLAEGALAGAEAIDDRAGAAHACNYIALSRSRRGLDGAEHGRLALALYMELGAAPEVADARNSLGMNASRFGRWDEAVEHYTEAEAVVSGLGLDLAAAVVLNNLGELRAKQWRSDEALAAFERARSTFAAAGHAYEAVALANVARALSQLGRHDEAGPLFDESVDRMRGLGFASHVVETKLHRAAGAIDRGRLDEAAALLEDVGEAEDAAMACMHLRLRGWLALESGDPAAVGLLSDAVDRAAEARSDYEGALAGLLLAEARRRAGLDGSDLRAGAVSVLSRLGVVWAPYL